jgi:hypothetical protein
LQRYAPCQRGGTTTKAELANAQGTKVNFVVMIQNEEHLKLLSIFHYIVGGMAALFALIPIIHLTLGVMMIVAPEKFAGQGQPPPAFLGWFFVGFATAFMLFGAAMAALIVTAGRFLAQRRRYTFCLVMAGVECVFMPFGTVLGVFTILVLMREPVKQMFAQNSVG